MALSIEVIKIAQGILIENGFAIGSIDGLVGPKTNTALNQILGITKNWHIDRKLVALIQLYAKELDIDVGTVDGLWGPKTQFAYDCIKQIKLFGKIDDPWRSEDIVKPTNPNNWPVQTLEELNAFYGPAKATGNSNLVSVNFPYPMVIAWDVAKLVTKTTCHKLVKDSLVRILTQVKTAYGIGEIERLKLNYYGGCFNYREMRGGTSLSTHSWGIALDFDPIRNQLKWDRTKASFARPEYVKWWEIWEAEGWVSLGRQRNYDWMHVQASKLLS